MKEVAKMTTPDDMTVAEAQGQDEEIVAEEAAVQEEAAPAKPVYHEPYRIEDWEGHANYKCPHCNFKTLHVEQIEPHIEVRHQEDWLKGV